MNETMTCIKCRYYIPLTDTTGYCGNYQLSKPTTPAARACGVFEPRPERKRPPEHPNRTP